MKSIYTQPKVTKPSDPTHPWFVWFRYAGKLKRIKLGINYIKDLQKREIEANLLCEAVRQKLKEGWNPFPETVPSAENSFADNLLLTDALRLALRLKEPRIKSKTQQDYKGTVNFCIDAIESLKLNKLLLTETKRTHIRAILTKAKETRCWSNNAFNKNLSYLQSVLSALIDEELIEHNPAHKIKPMPVAVSQANIPADPEQMQLIKKQLQEKHPDYFVFVQTIFHTGIRPGELRKLQLHMIDFRKQQITLPPGITKTDKERIVPINPHLSVLLKDHLAVNSENFPTGFPSSFFLFGTFKPSTQRQYQHQRDFIPGPHHLPKNRASSTWLELIKRSDLKIDVNLYSNKHAGADAKILAGINLDSLRELYGHSSKQMTEKYARAVKEVYRAEIIEKSPAF